MVNIFEGLEPIRPGPPESQLDKELAQLVSSLMTLENIELKSEVNNPLNLTRLKLFGRWAASEGISGADKAVDEFIEYYLRYYVSHRRQGRLEVVRAISEWKSKIQKTLLGPRESEQ